MFFNRREDPVVEAIEARMSAWTMLPANNGEGLQVLQYKVGTSVRRGCASAARAEAGRRLPRRGGGRHGLPGSLVAQGTRGAGAWLTRP